MDKQKQSEEVPELSDVDLDMLDPERTGDDACLMQTAMRSMVVGQTEALDQIVNVYQKYKSGMSEPGRPISNMLFLGPSGSGKTRSVEALSHFLFGDTKAVIKIDCAEYQHSHDIAKLIGSPPGYLGHRETPPLLSQTAINKYHTDKVKISLVLFDEIEKASDALWNLLLGILDKAIMTLGDNTKVNFERCIIFMTGNIGAADITRYMTGGTGFTPPSSKQIDTDIKKVAQAAAKRKFTPEFMGRLDHIIVFNNLGASDMEHILTIELNNVQQLVFNSAATTPFVFRVMPGARSMLLRDGIDPKYGARFLKRTISRMITNQLSNLITSGQVKGGDMVEIEADKKNEKLTFKRVREGMAATKMMEEVDQSGSKVIGADTAAVVDCRNFEQKKTAPVKRSK